MRNTKFMNKIKKIFSFILLTGFAFSTNAQGSVTSEVGTSATIIETISVASVTAMSFGDLTNDGGTIVLDTDGDITDNGSRSVGGTSAAAGLTVSGGDSESFKLTVTEKDKLTNQTGGGGETMDLTAFTSTISNAASATAVGSGKSYSLSGTGSATIAIGATLTVGASQVGGSYTGKIEVIVAYD